MNYRIIDVKEIRVIYEENDKEETTSSTTDEESRFGEYTDRARCEICSKTYDSYMRTLYVQYSNDETDIKCCCPKCLSKEVQKKPHRYTNHIPQYVDGGRLITRLFDTKEDLICWLKDTFADENKVLCCTDYGTIVTVNKNKKFWWTEGYSTLSKGDLPNNSEVIVKYHGKV